MLLTCSGEPLGHDLGDVSQVVQLREKPLHSLARHVPAELVQISNIERHDVPVGRGGVRAEEAGSPVIPPVFDRRELPYRRGVRLKHPTLVVLGIHPFLEVDQHDHRRHAGPLAPLHDDLVHVAPDPVLPRLEGLHERVLRGVEVLGSVLVLGRFATSHVAADEALAQVHPAFAHLEALLAALGARGHILDLVQVRALRREISEHGYLLSKRVPSRPRSFRTSRISRSVPCPLSWWPPRPRSRARAPPRRTSRRGSRRRRPRPRPSPPQPPSHYRAPPAPPRLRGRPSRPRAVATPPATGSAPPRGRRDCWRRLRTRKCPKPEWL